MGAHAARGSRYNVIDQCFLGKRISRSVTNRKYDSPTRVIGKPRTYYERENGPSQDIVRIVAREKL